MKSASIRELKQATPEILGWVQAGHLVQITKHNKVVAVMTMPSSASKQTPECPDFAMRLKQTWGGKTLGVSSTELIHEERGDR
jgi:antitoxin (DNA-binding transcriptional repressor) of toxin-antitoxin stability system